jgi:hypothetical protein
MDKAAVASYPPPDLTIERIGDLVNYDLEELAGGSGEMKRSGTA